MKNSAATHIGATAGTPPCNLFRRHRPGNETDLRLVAAENSLPPFVHSATSPSANFQSASTVKQRDYFLRIIPINFLDVNASSQVQQTNSRQNCSKQYH
jgi:hypothetical protein